MNENERTNLKEMDLPALEAFFTEMGEKRYRAEQVFQWMYRGADSFDEMTDLPLPLREKLAETCDLGCLRMAARQVSKADGTRKYLFALFDGNAIETVFMKYQFGNALCISSQAGCGMGCSFCASGQDGLARNLSAGEMVDQVLRAGRDTGEKINNITVMGTGEPFDNYEELARFLHLIGAKEGLGVGARHITVSTCGIPSMIDRFSADFPQVNLAVSLHAANDNKRNALMPGTSAWPLTELLPACRRYTEKTNRRITFEYALIQGYNDSPEDAKELAEEVSGLLCHVNLILLNPVTGTGLRAADKDRLATFKNRLERSGIPVTVRRRMGSDIDAACGQLRAGAGLF